GAWATVSPRHSFTGSGTTPVRPSVDSPRIRRQIGRNRRLAVLALIATVLSWLVVIPSLLGPHLPRILQAPLFSHSRSKGELPRSSTGERDYMVILENAPGDPLREARAELIGDGGAYTCVTDNYGACAIKHVPLTPNLTLRVSAHDRRL